MEKASTRSGTGCLALNPPPPPINTTRYDETVRLRDCPAHRAARSRALSAVGRLDAALEDMDVAAEGEPEVGKVHEA